MPPASTAFATNICQLDATGRGYIPMACHQLRLFRLHTLVLALLSSSLRSSLILLLVVRIGNLHTSALVRLPQRHFNATGSETAVNLTIYCGFGFAAFINGHLISTVSTNAESLTAKDYFRKAFFIGGDHINALFPFPNRSVVPGEDNMLTVIQDNMGLEEHQDEKFTRGIDGF